MADNKRLRIADKIVSGLEDFAAALESGADVTETFSCHKVVLELEPSPYDPALVKQTRELLRASQTIFAQFLGVSANSVRSWEQGRKTPQAVACRFMDEIRNDPEYWKGRLRESVRPKHEMA